jgi:Fe-S-cluster containining protein
LCCQGLLHSHAALDQREIALARGLGLRLHTFPDGVGFYLPCSLYKAGLCYIYERRPRACAEYECDLLRRFAANELSLEACLFLVARIKRTLAGITRARQALI